MAQWILTLLSSVLVPIVVALISSGKMADKVTKKMQIEELRTEIASLKSQLEELTNKIESLDYKVDSNQATNNRGKFLGFNGQIKRGIHHDEEEFNDVLEAIDKYESFCRDNPNYPNNKAVLAIENIKNVYKKAYSKNDF